MAFVFIGICPYIKLLQLFESEILTIKNMVYAVSLSGTEKLENIFGKPVLQSAWSNLLTEITPRVYEMFGRYQNVQFVQQYENMFIVKASFMASDSMLDPEEQQEILLSAGSTFMRDALLKHFGAATGRKLAFSNFCTLVKDREQLSEHSVRLELQKNGTLQDLHLGNTKSELSPCSNITRQEFSEILQKDKLQTFVQSIVDLQRNEVAGFEILTRGPKGSNIERADKLFNTATYFGMTKEIELACVRKGINYVKQVPSHQFLTFNVGPEVLTSPELSSLLEDPSIKPYHQQIVFELTEHLPLSDVKKITHVVQEMHHKGIQVWLDDTGCGFFDFSTAEMLKTPVAKLCITVIRQISKGHVIECEIEETRKRLNSLGTKTLGEGVEEKEQAEVLQRLGVQLAQGYYFHKPTPIEQVFNYSH
ncbi:EAL domain-containing protein [Marinomonas sp. 2405UD68-3]|uniref:EAL domain-containing protein n=1 Tax=Marinomonas sp. 2405UD68-3 TaxID=3391835 RepID=UPI0039C9B016